MVVINFIDQLQRGTFEHAINHLIENKLDLSVFDSAYNNDDNGRPAYDPAILLKIILFAYSKGIISSREIQWCCEYNIIFKALSCDTVPHYTTIAHFVSSHPKAIHAIFEQIVLTCYQDGLIGNELFAIDGCKMSSDAAKEWSGTIKELTEKREKIKRQIETHIKRHEAYDKTDTDEQNVDAIKRTEQALATLDNAYEKIDDFLKTAEPRIGEGKRKKEVKSNITDNESAKMTTSKGTIQGFNALTTADKLHQIIIDAQTFGSGPEQHTLTPIIEAIRHRFDRLDIPAMFTAEGVMLTADTGFSSEDNMEYCHDEALNVYIPDNQFRSRDEKLNGQKEKHRNPNQVKNKKEKRDKKASTFAASEFVFDPKALSCHCPAGEALRLSREQEDKHGNQKIYFEGRISQCRHCHIKNECLKSPSSVDGTKGHGRQVSFITEAKKSTSTFIDWMKNRIDTEEGKQIYSHRMSVIEPVFGNICANKGLNKFSLRGKVKVQAQWQLYCIVHNIEKLMNYGKITA